MQKYKNVNIKHGSYVQITAVTSELSSGLSKQNMQFHVDIRLWEQLLHIHGLKHVKNLTLGFLFSQCLGSMSFTRPDLVTRDFYRVILCKKSEL